jgi:hypothetical protein
MERHQIENRDLKEYRAKECKSSKERSPADIYNPSLGAWDVHHKKPAFVATPQLFLFYQCASSAAKLRDAG